MNKVLITGGNGFLGHHMIDHILSTTNLEVIALNITGNKHRIESLDSFYKEPNRLRFIKHDISTPLDKELLKESVDLILHMGGESHVLPSIQNPLNTVITNVVGTCNLLNYAKSIKTLHSFVYFSSDEVFGPVINNRPHREEDSYHPKNPYAATKAGAEELCISYHSTYGVPIKIARCMNIFGERQPSGKFIPSTIRKILNREMIQVHGSVKTKRSSSRCYIHAKEVCLAVDKIIRDGINGERYHVVGDKEIDNLQLVDKISSIMGKEAMCDIVDCTISHSGHGIRHAMDGTKMKELGWHQMRSFEERLEETIGWYLSNREWLSHS